MKTITISDEVWAELVRFKAGDLISKKYYSISSYTEVELLDLLEWASRGLTSALGE